ncbi:plasmid replication protein, CyRepA1 family [Burkholderia pseudomallei]|uniref:plasmid replication protein, CyRepA1 family n=1 Tax=Burkholderia pseudomallei TaxID=28450 RepID=UPI0005367F2F|nr:plasmid replication protein, CyRepA1 family [Burkholderia pseudomallei]KGW92081.1 origin of replication binding family protein [Burkholderia pseudomallei MSHR456]
MSKSSFHTYSETNVSSWWHEQSDLVPYKRPLKLVDDGRLYGQIVVDSRYLASDVPTDARRLHDANVIMVKAPKGTGKTQWARKYLKSIPRQRSVLQISHRQSLSTVLSNELDLKCYLDDKEAHWRYSVSLDSIELVQHCAYDVLILDESEQALRHLIGETTKENREAIFNVLVKLAWSAKQIICLDADMTDELTGYAMSKLRRDFESDRVLAIVNKWKMDRAIEIYQDKNHLIAELVTAIFGGKRVYIPVSELGLANTLKSLLERLVRADGEKIDVLILTGETNNDDRHKAFFQNPNEEAKKYQVLISTSTLSTGVSIDVEWFEAVYGIFSGNIYTYQDCDQAISRVRKCDTVKVWIYGGGKREFESEAAIRNGVLEKEVRTRRIIFPDEDASITKAQQTFLDMYARITWCNQEWKMNRIEKFRDLKIEEGWRVSLVATDSAMRKAGSEMLRFGTDPFGTKKADLILKARNIDFEEADALRAKDRSDLSREQKRSLTKWSVCEFFGLKSPAQVTLQQIQQYQSDEVRDVLKNMRLLRDSRQLALERDQYERESDRVTRALTDYDHRVMKRDLFGGALAASGIDRSEAYRRAARYKEIEDEYAESMSIIGDPNSRPGRAASKHRREQLAQLDWIVTDEMIDSVARYASSKKKEVNMFLGTNFTTPEADEAKTKVFNALLGRLGIAIKKNRKKDSTGYVIDYKRMAELSPVVSDADLAVI